MAYRPSVRVPQSRLDRLLDDEADKKGRGKLPKDAGELARVQKALEGRTGIFSREGVIARLEALALADIGVFLGPKGDVLDPADWPKGATMFLKAVKHTQMGISLELWDPMRALKLLAQLYGVGSQDDNDASFSVEIKRIMEKSAVKVPGVIDAEAEDD